VANLVDAAEVGLAHGSAGYLITDWGDGGHMQPPSVSFGPIVYGGAVSWSLAANRDLDLPAVLNRYVFADTTGTLGGVFDTLGRAWRQTGQRATNCSPLFLAVAPDIRHLVSGQPDIAKLMPLVGALDGAIADIARSQPGCADGDLVRHELTTAAHLARHGAYRLLRQADAPAPDTAALHADITTNINAHTHSWLARSRPGGLPEKPRPPPRHPRRLRLDRHHRPGVPGGFGGPGRFGGGRYRRSARYRFIRAVIRSGSPSPFSSSSRSSGHSS
jgi:hypothetical protein